MVEYFGENPKTTQPSMFFPPFGRFIKAYKVRKCSFLCPPDPMNQSLLTAINPCLHDRAQTAQQEIEQRKKMENREEKETSSSSSPSKAAAQKVSHMLERFTQIIVWSFVQHSIN